MRELCIPTICDDLEGLARQHILRLEQIAKREKDVIKERLGQIRRALRLPEKNHHGDMASSRTPPPVPPRPHHGYHHGSKKTDGTSRTPSRTKTGNGATQMGEAPWIHRPLPMTPTKTTQEPKGIYSFSHHEHSTNTEHSVNGSVTIDSTDFTNDSVTKVVGNEQPTSTDTSKLNRDVRVERNLKHVSSSSVCKASSSQQIRIEKNSSYDVSALSSQESNRLPSPPITVAEPPEAGGTKINNSNSQNGSASRPGLAKSRDETQTSLFVPIPKGNVKIKVPLQSSSRSNLQWERSIVPKENDDENSNGSKTTDLLHPNELDANGKKKEKSSIVALQGGGRVAAMIKQFQERKQDQETVTEVAHVEQTNSIPVSTCSTDGKVERGDEGKDDGKKAAVVPTTTKESSPNKPIDERNSPSAKQINEESKKEIADKEEERKKREDAARKLREKIRRKSQQNKELLTKTAASTPKPSPTHEQVKKLATMSKNSEGPIDPSKIDISSLPDELGKLLLNATAGKSPLPKTTFGSPPPPTRSPVTTEASGSGCSTPVTNSGYRYDPRFFPSKKPPPPASPPPKKAPLEISKKENKLSATNEKRVASPETYDISDREDDDDDEGYDSETEKRHQSSKRVPAWAMGKALESALNQQYGSDGQPRDPDTIFGEFYSCNLEEIFAGTKKKRYSKRTSSGNWIEDRLTVVEKLAYKRDMGFRR